MSERSDLISKLVNDDNAREAYVRSKVCTNVSSQLRALRRRREMTQEALAVLSGMKQSRISAMERPGTRWNVDTLVRLASALRSGLVVRITSFAEMVEWENRFSQDQFNVATIEEDSDFLAETEPQDETWVQPTPLQIARGCAASKSVATNQQREQGIEFGALASIGALNRSKDLLPSINGTP